MAQYLLSEVAVVLREGDDVAVATRTLTEGTEVSWPDGGARLRAEVLAGHKIAMRSIADATPVHKYGQVIGYATQGIAPGDWVHTHNLAVGSTTLTYEYSTDLRVPLPVPDGEERTFHGYADRPGRAGTRNYVAVISTVNCSADAVHMLVARLRREALPLFPRVDDVFPITHDSGCGMAIGGPAYTVLQRTLAGIADHPNVAGAILVGLGCETNQPLSLAQAHGLIPLEAVAGGRPTSPIVVSIQEAGGVARAVDLGVERALPLLRAANERRRTHVPIGELAIGTNCGGSDGNSGITANPALGMAGDEFVRHGAAWVLAETSETYGAEHLLARRAVSPDVGQKLVKKMRWWERYTAEHGATIDNNPSPGNKLGGLTTIVEKSLGAVAKSGSSPLVAVYDYAERVAARGLSFMDTPGMDNVSVTGIVAGGCSLVAFTTGRGSCLGCKPAPVLKIATNTPMFERMRDDMDLNAGVILDGVSVQDVGRTIFEELVAVASGKRTKSEAQGLGDYVFAPWSLGPVL